jgi:hypothetical protein
VRRHGVVRYAAPGVVQGGRLREPDIASVASELATLEGIMGNRIIIIFYFFVQKFSNRPPV